ncbi:uncharacterized protein LOC142632354 [Castanea sativa]|uniref:uncharacterized protein LOC142632354 n=1 Tax=Castanea sativa TaxID=21020 RepID=UPI003F64E108
MGEVNVAFRELGHRIVDQIKNEPYFKWQNKIVGDPSRRNQNLYCTYHKDKGHTTEQCMVLKDHLEQLVKAGCLKEFIVEPRDQEAGQAARLHENPLPPSLGESPAGKKLRYTQQPIAFDDDDMKGTIQPHEDVWVVTARINGFIVKRVMID